MGGAPCGEGGEGPTEQGRSQSPSAMAWRNTMSLMNGSVQHWQKPITSLPATATRQKFGSYSASA